MFPSSNNTNNYLHPSFGPSYFNQSTSSSSSSSLFGHGSDNNFFLQHHHNFPPGQFLLACVPETTVPAMAASPNIGSQNLMPERHVRKDRHSKIYTSHGLRDRRVRLSIGIARQFFDLQDLLGFDKASNTIEWLLIKSRKAIRKLTESRAKSTGGLNHSSSVDSEHEMGSEDDEEVEEGSDQDGLFSKSKSVIEAYGEEMNKLLAKESRAKARSRAKERTRDKMYIRKLSELTDGPEPIMNQTQSSPGGFTGGELFEDVAEFGNPISNSREHNHVPRVDSSLEESIVIKPVPSLNYQQTWMLSKDLNSYISCTPQSWDITGATIRPSFAAHSSMNPSGEHQNYGNSWEGQNDGHLEQ